MNKKIDSIDDIVNEIEQLKQLDLLIEQYQIERKIEGPTEEILEKEKSFVKELERQKSELLEKIGTISLDYATHKLTDSTNMMVDTLNEFTKILKNINFDNVLKLGEQLEEYKYKILKSKENKTFGQEIEIFDYENSLEKVEFKERENEKKEKQKDSKKTNKNRKNKIGIKDKFLSLLNRIFNKKVMLSEKNDTNIELNEKDIDQKENGEKTFKQKLQEQIIENSVQNKTPEELKQEQLKKYFESVENAKKRLKEQSKLYSTETEWKNGNIIIKQDLEENCK